MRRFSIDVSRIRLMTLLKELMHNVLIYSTYGAIINIYYTAIITGIFVWRSFLIYIQLKRLKQFINALSVVVLTWMLILSLLCYSLHMSPYIFYPIHQFLEKLSILSKILIPSYNLIIDTSSCAIVAISLSVLLQKHMRKSNNLM